jgi:sugar lactone lactonase YvrE
VFIDSLRNLYITGGPDDFVPSPTAIGHVVRRVDADTGLIATVAGTNGSGYNGDSIQATSALLHSPHSVTVDAAGTLYIADTFNNRIRAVNAQTGLITTVAGNGQAGFSGDGGSSGLAMICWPRAIALDSRGNLYITDFGSGRIRRVMFSNA